MRSESPVPNLDRAMSIVPEVLRRTPPAETLAWVAAQVPGGQVEHVERLAGSWGNAIHGCDVTDASGTRHRWVLRRWARPEFVHEAVDCIPREAAAFALANAAAIPAPELVATDRDAEHCDVPALLMTRLTGRPEHDAEFLDAHLDELVAWCARIHDVTVDGEVGPYEPWYSLDERPPPWATDPSAWQRAIDALHDFVAPPASNLLHRDYHPGNLLWEGTRLTGVVDWVSACSGRAEVDIAHCRHNLALLCGMPTADAFLARYRALTGRAVELQTMFDVASAVDWLPGPPDAWRYADVGREDLDVGELVRREELFMLDVVARL